MVRIIALLVLFNVSALAADIRTVSGTVGLSQNAVGTTYTINGERFQNYKDGDPSWSDRDEMDDAYADTLTAKAGTAVKVKITYSVDSDGKQKIIAIDIEPVATRFNY